MFMLIHTALILLLFLHRLLMRRRATLHPTDAGVDSVVAAWHHPPSPKTSQKVSDAWR
jgi:hypothetical protein